MENTHWRCQSLLRSHHVQVLKVLKAPIQPVAPLLLLVRLHVDYVSKVLHADLIVDVTSLLQFTDAIRRRAELEGIISTQFCVV